MVAADRTRRIPSTVPVGAGGATLHRLMAGLRQPLLQMVCAPAGTDVRIGAPVIWDAAARGEVRSGSVVLAVGAAARSDAGIALVAAAAGAGAAAVVFKIDGDCPSALYEAALADRIALISAAADAPWGEVYTLLLAALVGIADGVPVSDAGPAQSDLFTLADAVASAVGGAVTIEDASSRVLAYSTVGHPVDATRRETILARRAPTECITNHQAEGVLRSLAMTDDPVQVASRDCDHPPRLAIGLRVGSELLGSIWVAEGDAPFDDATEDALRRAAPVVTMQLAERRLAESVDRRRRASVLQTFFEGRGSARAIAAALGLDVHAPLLVAAMSPADERDQKSPVMLERALGYVALCCDSSSNANVCFMFGKTIYLLQPVPAGTSEEAVVTVLEKLVQDASSALRFPLIAGVGSVVRGLADVTQSRSEAERVLQVLVSQRAEARVATFAQLKSQATLVSLLDLLRTRPEYDVGRVARLVDVDQVGRSRYVETLRAYFAAASDVGVASRRINVHPNTFRYRLSRATDLVGVELKDPDDMFLLQLEMRVYDAAGNF